MQRLRDAGLTQQQAEAIASMPEAHLLTREYFDASREADREHLETRIAQLESSLTWRIAGMAGLVIVLVGLIDKFVRP
jgi:C4-dicarboxylate transporter